MFDIREPYADISDLLYKSTFCLNLIKNSEWNLVMSKHQLLDSSLKYNVKKTNEKIYIKGIKYQQNSHEHYLHKSISAE